MAEPLFVNEWEFTPNTMYFDFFILSKRHYLRRYQAGEISYHTWSGAMSMLESFRRFCCEELGTDSLPVQEFKADILERYKLYCIRKGNKPVTVNRKLVPLLVCLQKSQSDGLVPLAEMARMKQAYYPSHTRSYGLEASRLFPEGSESVHALSDRQMKRLIKYYRETKRKSAGRALELFLFSFHACGLRVSDIVTLEWRHIDFRGAQLSKVSVKTKAPVTIPLSAPALAILGRWKGLHGRFVFGLLPENMDLGDDAALAKAVDYRNRSLRMTLNRIGRELDFPFPLGMHVARHTFAVMALNNTKLNVHMISRLLGHASVLVTEKVYARYLLPTLAEEVRKNLSFSEFMTDF